LLQSGFRIIEIPLNSPNAFESVGKLVTALGSRAVVGAGTVVDPRDVERLAAVGSELCVSPNTNADLIRRTKTAGMISIPGVFTPTEAFIAIAAGADALKLFPAEISGPTGLRALRTVLPAGMPVFPVGGVGLSNLCAFLQAGAAAAGFGSSLFAPGDSAEVVRHKATALAAAWRSKGC
jgi:2-dehydro-3-deoxyphosphogalactonate aldolase